MTEFGLTFSKKNKTVNWGSAERGDLKKQSQFLKGLNGRKINYNKVLREIYWIGHLVKTNPNKPNII